LQAGGCPREGIESRAAAMVRTLVHRGPDDEGIWTDSRAGVALAARRLAILDLSAAGHQPMVSGSGRFVMVFNGEVYNYQALRDEILSHARVPFRGRSDTEVVLSAIENWGIEGALERCDGMFALALWDRERRELTLARDRFGEKPLYYGWAGDALLFASELKALRAYGAAPWPIDRDALALYLQYSAVPAPYSIYRGVKKLPPASFLTFGRTAERWPEPRPYWSLRDAALAGVRQPFGGSAAEAMDSLEQLLRGSVHRRMVSDVPLGAFLSGGIDSSTVVALMRQVATASVKTFTIGIHDAELDEAAPARAVAQHLQTDHTELYVTPQEACAVIPLLPAIYDEPFADASQIPTYLVARLARQQVTVALSGDGGDELFGGYNRHVWAGRLWKRVGWMPSAWRRAIGSLLGRVPAAHWQSLVSGMASVSEGMRHRSAGQKVHKLGYALSASDFSDFYRKLATHWHGPVVHGALPLPLQEPPELPDLAEQMMYLDSVTYLPDDILVKLDRATMAVSLEARAPFLDHRVVEFAWRLPLHMKVRGHVGKRILRELLHRYVPPALVDRPKAGFGIPLGDWLRGPLRTWAEALLDERRLRHDGFFDPAAVTEKWSQLLAGKGTWEYHVWDVLMFQAWLEEQSPQRSAALEALSQRA